MVGLAGGLLFSAKYNFFIYVPFLAVAFGYLVYRGHLPWSTVLRMALAVACGTILISGFWYVRNYWLYGTPIPLLLGEERLAQLRGFGREVVPVNRGLSHSRPSSGWFSKSYATITFASFFGLFGYLDVGFRPAVYTALRIIIPSLGILFLCELLLTRDRIAEVACLWLGAFMLAVLGLHVWTCLCNDFQPPGPISVCQSHPHGRFSGLGREPSASVTEIRRSPDGGNWRADGPGSCTFHPNVRGAPGFCGVLGWARGPLCGDQPGGARGKKPY